MLILASHVVPKTGPFVIVGLGARVKHLTSTTRDSPFALVKEA